MIKKSIITLIFAFIFISSTMTLGFQINKEKENTIKNLTNGTSWSKVFGGTDWDQAYTMKPTTDGGYIIAGYTDSFGAGEKDGWLIKIDSYGNQEWSSTYGGVKWDIFQTVLQTNDNGFIVIGSTKSYGEGKADGWIVKTDELGSEIWNQTIGGYGNDYIRDICPTNDGGFVLVGTTPYTSGKEKTALWLRKIDSNGNRIWHTTNGVNIYGLSVQETMDGGFIISGEISHDLYLMKTNQIGKVLWEKSFDRVGWERGLSIKQTNDNGFIVAGITSDYSDSNIWVLKTDEYGEEEWDKVIGDELYDRATSVCLTSDEGYVITGTKQAPDSFFDVCLIKFDKDGNKKFEKIYGGSGGDEAFYVQQTDDKGFIICGYTISNAKYGGADAWVIKTDKIDDGAGQQTKNYCIFDIFTTTIRKILCYNNNIFFKK